MDAGYFLRPSYYLCFFKQARSEKRGPGTMSPGGSGRQPSVLPHLQHQVLENIVELTAAALHFAQHRVDTLGRFQPVFFGDGSARGGADEQFGLGIERLVIHARAAGMHRHAADIARETTSFSASVRFRE